MSINNNYKYLTPSIFKNYNHIKAVMSTKIGGNCLHGYCMNLSYKVGDYEECVNNNREIFFNLLNVTEKNVVTLNQRHTTNILYASKAGIFDNCDALYTDKKNLALAVTIADCVPVLLYDSKKQIIASIHAGWKGSANKITFLTVKELKHKFNSNPKDIIAYIGPSAGKCCYNVGKDVSVKFKDNVVNYKNNNIYVDLKQENKNQLLENGILETNIEVSPNCTICERDTFHSYRRDGNKSGRMMAAICIK